MKLKHLLKNISLVTAFSLFNLTLMSCDGGSDSNTTSLSNTSGSNATPTSSSNESMRRITLAGDASGTTPIDTNSEAQIRIDGNLVSQMVVENNGIITVDVPFGSLLEVRFIPAQGVIGYIRNVVCIYDDADPETVTTGAQAVLPGVSPYTCPLNVSSSGAVELIQNPTAEQLGGEFILRDVTIVTEQTLPNFTNGSRIVLGNNSIRIGGITYTQTTNQELLSAFESAVSSLEGSLQEGLGDFQFLITGSGFEDLTLFLIGRDGDLAGQISYSRVSGETVSAAAGTFNLE